MATSLPPPGADDVLYVVDLSGFVFRAFHATPPLTSPSGEPTNATLVTVTMLERLARKVRPAMLAVAMDSKGPTFRTVRYPEYKAHRPPPPPELGVQMNRVGELVRAFAIPVLQQDGVEADDLIATAVRHARAEGIRVVIVSADKDLMQLVGPDVTMWDTMRERVVGVPEVEERFGVPVARVRDALALMGDASDNVPGVPSVGPKTAKDLLVAFGDLESALAAARDGRIQRKKLAEALVAHAADALLSFELVTLKDDCPIEFDRAHLAWGGRDVQALDRLYRELGFLRLAEQLEAERSAPGAQAPAATRDPAPAASPAPAPPAAPTLVTTEAALARVCERIRETGRVGLSLHAAARGPLSPLVGLALAPAPGEVAYVPLLHRALGAPPQLAVAAGVRLCGPLLADPSLAKCVVDSKSARGLLEPLGIALHGVRLDPAIASYLLDPERAHDVSAIAQRELGLTLGAAAAPPRRGREALGFDELPIEEAAAHAGARADAALRLLDPLRSKLVEERLASLHDDLELPLGAVLARMEREGVLIDVRALAALGAELRRRMAELESRAHAVAGRPFNVASPRQLETLLFDEFGLAPRKRTKTSRSTDAETLEALAEEHELPGIVLEHRQLAKLEGTYVETLPRLVDPRTGRVHTRWEQTVAATGRLSSVDPNLQNIPVRSELGRSIRAAFVARPGHVILSADYSQIELRVLAHLSGDPVLVEAFQTGDDVHRRTAMEIFELRAEDVTAEHRRRAKAVNFGVIYGQGDSGLAKSLGISRLEAGNFIAAYFRRHQGVRRFMDATLEAAGASESVHTLLGRRRLVPDIRSPNRARRLAAERVAMNTPIQGTAADLLKLAMLALADPPSPGARMTLTVHDELVFEVPEAEVEAAADRVRAAMEGAYSLAVPLVVDVRHGRSWADAH
ncbi:MAG: DNA polymerase I [Polyangiaceae bacterium]|nr:DNA polymerase I [Polyangiaceae bacterium]